LVTFDVPERALSSVDATGGRAVEPGAYELFVGGGQPGQAPGSAVKLAIRGRRPLPR
jgi:beta-glucosidase